MKKSILKVVHETAKGLHDARVMDTETMRTFDALCLLPVRDLVQRKLKIYQLVTRR